MGGNFCIPPLGGLERKREACAGHHTACRLLCPAWHRCEIFLQARQQLEQEHGHDYVAEQAHFFAAMANLYHKLPDPGRAERSVPCFPKSLEVD